MANVKYHTTTKCFYHHGILNGRFTYEGNGVNISCNYLDGLLHGMYTETRKTNIVDIYGCSDDVTSHTLYVNGMKIDNLHMNI